MVRGKRKEMQFRKKTKRYTAHVYREWLDERLRSWLDRVDAWGTRDIPEDEADALFQELFDLLDDDKVFFQAFWFTKLPWWMIGQRQKAWTPTGTTGAKKYAREHPCSLTCGCQATDRNQEDGLEADGYRRYRFRCRGKCPSAIKQQQEERLRWQRAEEERVAKMTPYERYLQSEEWEQLRREVFQRDKYRCRRCGDRNQLHCHHLHYETLYEEELEDLVTMCKDCHKEVHKFPELHPDWIQYDAKAQRKRDPEFPPQYPRPIPFGFGAVDVEAMVCTAESAMAASGKTALTE